MFALVKTENVKNPATGETSEVELIKLFLPYIIFEDKFGTQHSPDTLINWTTEQRQNAGIYDVAYQDRLDDRFYTIIENNPIFDSVNKIVKITFTCTPKQLEDSGEGVDKVLGLKSQWINTFKGNANKILENTDWMLVRKIERDIDIPANVVSYRAAVLAEVDRLQTAISETTTVEELITAINSAAWPELE